MVLLNAGNDRQKLYQELVIFMNSPEIAEHFVIWLFGEVERLEQEQIIPLHVQQPQSQSQPQETAQSSVIVSSQEIVLQNDVQMGSGAARLQGTRNFSKALESAISPLNRAQERNYESNFERNYEDFERNYEDFDRSNTRSNNRSNERKSPRKNIITSSSRRIVRSSPGEGVQKIKLSVDFDREEGNRKRTSFKKIQTTEEGDGASPVIKVKCQYWPNCRAGEACPNVHPSETCKHFPNCQFGDSCTFVHPSIPCKFQEKCQNPLCNYQHRPMAAAVYNPLTAMNPSLSTIQCKFYPRCVNLTCPYLHPVKVQCRYGIDCSRPDCPFEHASGRKGAHLKSVIFSPCKYGKQCARADCPYQHELDNNLSGTNMDISSTNPQILPSTDVQ